MAGRGTDIKLEEGVTELGGLCILGTERHEARRIDNQLRGRAGRQGDPGESVFFVSMEDDLMRLFGGDRLKAMMERLKVPDDVPLENRIVSRSIESAQKKVEGRNFDIRRHVVQYDDVMNKHREIVYVRRQNILDKIAEDESDVGCRTSDVGSSTSEVRSSKSEELTLHEDILQALRGEANSMVDVHALGSDPEKWDTKEISQILGALHPQLVEFLPGSKLKEFNDREKMRASIKDLLLKFYDAKCKEFGEEAVRQAERVVTLRSIDTHWMDHIDEMSHLREQVAFSGYAQRDPLIEYKDQGFRKFEQLLAAIDSSIVRTLLQIDFAQFTPQVFLDRAQEEISDLQTNEDQIESELTETGVTRGQNVNVMADSAGPPRPGDDVETRQRRVYTEQAPRQIEKVGRNDPCPCGSGKKYKKCCGG